MIPYLFQNDWKLGKFVRSRICEKKKVADQLRPFHPSCKSPFSLSKECHFVDCVEISFAIAVVQIIASFCHLRDPNFISQ